MDGKILKCMMIMATHKHFLMLYRNIAASSVKFLAESIMKGIVLGNDYIYFQPVINRILLEMNIVPPHVALAAKIMKQDVPDSND